jgi:AcrR family transcriptional regulator
MAKPTDARTSILDAAERLFSRRGFAATTIKMIAAESSQNSALIYYYYDNKASLYRHVIERVVGEIQAEAARRIPAAASPERVIAGVVESQVAVLATRPTLPVLMARELIDWKAAHAEPAIRNLSATLFARIRAAITEGQLNGTFREDLDPRFAAVSVIAQVGYLVLASPIAGILLGRGTDGPTEDDLRAFGVHAAEFALAALRVQPPRPLHESLRTEAASR